MARFTRLTRADLNTLTRAELLERIEAEQQFWERKHQRPMSDADRAGYREFTAIMHAAVDPGEALDDAKRLLTQGRAAATYWDEIPGKVTEMRDRDRPTTGDKA